MKLKKNDNVIIRTGKDKGKKGKIAKILHEKNRVIVEGVNVWKRHQKPRRGGQKGAIADVTLSVHVSNVSLLDPKNNKPTRTGSKMIGDKKVRIAKKSGMEI